MTTFRYIHDTRECWHSEEPIDCLVCGQLRHCYYFIQMHEENYDEHYICEPCLLSGKLATQNLRVNTGDVDILRQQLRERMPEVPEAERDVLAVERTTEIETRTPGPNVRNFFTWPAHCGDYCVYLHPATAEDMNRLASDGDGETFLATHLHPDDADVEETFVQDAWEDKLQGFERFYLWQCPACSEYLLTYTSD